jgi:hypothetical protein
MPRCWWSSAATGVASWTCVVWPFQTSLDLLERPALRRDHDGRAEKARDGGETGMAQEPPPVPFSVGSRRHPFLLSRHADVEKAPHAARTPIRETRPCEAFDGADPRRDQVIRAGDCDAVRSQLGLGPANVGGVGALDSISLAGLEGARCLRTSQRPNRFVLLPLIRLQPGERARFLWRGLIPALSRTGRPTGVLGGDTGESRVTSAP